MEDNNKILGLYIHIPFCDHICSYCDFNKMIAKNEKKEKYISSLIKEAEHKINNFKDLKSIYIGGGTPSSLSFDLMERLLNKLSELINLNQIREFTMEMNPNDITDDNIKKWIDLFNKYHINRLSLGIQSFNNKKLVYLKRNHNKKIAIHALDLLHNNNFDNINCDLIYGFKKDKYKNIIKDMKIAIKHHVKHISYYSLILEEKTILYDLFKKGNEIEMDEDKEADIYNKIYKYLSKKHFMRYEISNFSIPGYESYHNLLTWNNLHYEAIGISASSYIENKRITNIKKIDEYINYVNKNEFDKIIKEFNILSKEDIIYEALILGLRKNNGINLNDFKLRYSEDLLSYYPNINHLINENILEINDGNLRIVCDKIYLENAIINKIIA